MYYVDGINDKKTCLTWLQAVIFSAPNSFRCLLSWASPHNTYTSCLDLFWSILHLQWPDFTHCGSVLQPPCIRPLPAAEHPEPGRPLQCREWCILSLVFNQAPILSTLHFFLWGVNNLEYSWWRRCIPILEPIRILHALSHPLPKHIYKTPAGIYSTVRADRFLLSGLFSPFVLSKLWLNRLERGPFLGHRKCYLTWDASRAFKDAVSAFKEQIPLVGGGGHAFFMLHAIFGHRL